MKIDELEIGELYSVKSDFHPESCNYVFCREFSVFEDGVFSTFYMFARHDTHFRSDIVYSLILYLTADEVFLYVQHKL